MVVYAGSEGVVLDPTRINEDGRGAVLDALNKLRSGGSTNGGAGIPRAYQLAQQNFVEGGVNRVILATDGDFNVGTTGQGDLVRLVKERAANGVFLSVLGFGSGNINDAMLEAITNDGTYSCTTNSSGTCNIDEGSGSYNDDTDIFLVVEKICTVPPTSLVSYTVTGHL